MRLFTLAPLFVLLGCPGGGATDEPTPPVVDCTAEGTQTLSQVAVPDWPAGLQDAIDRYRALDGRWTASACGNEVQISIRTREVLDTELDLITSPLEDGNTCGCAIDTPRDGNLDVIARTDMDVFVMNYPAPEFSEESAGNVPGMEVSFFASGDFTIRACAIQPVPAILGSEYRDTEVVFRSGPSGESGTVRLVGAGLADQSCELTSWTRVGDN